MSDPSDSSFTLSNFVVGFITGGVSSALVSYVFYRWQKRDAEAESRDLVLLLYRILKEGRESREVLERVQATVARLPSGERLGFILSEFASKEVALKGAHKKKEEYVQDVLTYKALADAYAHISAATEHFEILDQTGEISLERLVAAHSKMFPEGYVWSGRLRTQMVQIVGSFMPRGRSMGAALSSIQVGVTPPEQIPAELQRLLSQWSSSVARTKTQDEMSRCEELAHFHQQFLLIHPFLDGNGRMARAILREQSKFLFDVERSFEFDRASYYEALHLADLREPRRLAEMIRNEIRKG
jgi:fido (protein-threonine AMPylation protein)